MSRSARGHVAEDAPTDSRTSHPADGDHHAVQAVGAEDGTLDGRKFRLCRTEEGRRQRARRDEHAPRRRLGDRGATAREPVRDMSEVFAPPTGAASTTSHEGTDPSCDPSTGPLRMMNVI
jgi:hypothetical protein